MLHVLDQWVETYSLYTLLVTGGDFQERALYCLHTDSLERISHTSVITAPIPLV